MLRSIKSGQRKMRVLALKVESGSLSGPDARKASIDGVTITLNVPFAEAPVAIVSSVAGSTNALIATTSNTVVLNDTTDAHIIIMGSDVSEKY